MVQVMKLITVTSEVDRGQSTDSTLDEGGWTTGERPSLDDAPRATPPLPLKNGLPASPTTVMNRGTAVDPPDTAVAPPNAAPTSLAPDEALLPIRNSASAAGGHDH